MSLTNIIRTCASYVPFVAARASVARGEEAGRYMTGYSEAANQLRLIQIHELDLTHVQLGEGIYSSQRANRDAYFSAKRQPWEKIASDNLAKALKALDTAVAWKRDPKLLLERYEFMQDVETTYWGDLPGRCNGEDFIRALDYASAAKKANPSEAAYGLFDAMRYVPRPCEKHDANEHISMVLGAGGKLFQRKGGARD